VSDAEISAFLGRINRAIPGLGLSPRQVRHVFCGLLPVHTSGGTDLTSRESFVDHGARGGPKGLFSLTGMKFTTARRVAERAVARMLPESTASTAVSRVSRRALAPGTPCLLDGARVAALSEDEATRLIRETAASESVVHAEDFLLRRTNWMFSSPQPAALDRLVGAALGMGELRVADRGLSVLGQAERH
jgi:glycerol-3-phosphate dehydrogenase